MKKTIAIIIFILIVSLPFLLMLFSSKQKTTARSPRSHAVATNSVEQDDFPTPAGPSINVLVPNSIPLPNNSSREALPLCNVLGTRGSSRGASNLIRG